MEPRSRYAADNSKELMSEVAALWGCGVTEKKLILRLYRHLFRVKNEKLLNVILAHNILASRARALSLSA